MCSLRAHTYDYRPRYQVIYAISVTRMRNLKFCMGQRSSVSPASARRYAVEVFYSSRDAFETNVRYFERVSGSIFSRPNSPVSEINFWSHTLTRRK